MWAVFECWRDFRCLKTGLLAVADGGSAMAQETAQDMGLDQFLEAGEAAGGHHAAAGGMTSDTR
jgi:NAD(P)H-dependent flavin oxidoreductase YrpB (nitropropane dioxygenase family)